MKKNRLNLWLDKVLAFLFGVTSLALIIGESTNAANPSAARPWTLIHEVTGTLLFIGCAIHLLLHRNWIKALLSGRNRSTSANRVINLWLFGSGLVCGVAGIAAWSMLDGGNSIPYDDVYAVHFVSGLMMLAFQIIHLARHWKWISDIHSKTDLRTNRPKNSPG